MELFVLCFFLHTLCIDLSVQYKVLLVSIYSECTSIYYHNISYFYLTTYCMQSFYLL